MRFFRRPIPLPSRAAYARWAKFYPPHAHNPFMELETRVMRELLPDLHGKIVLDLACGTGRWGKEAQAHGAKQVISLDDSVDMLQAGRLRLAGAASMTAIPLAAHSIDVIVCGLAIGHTPHLEKTLSEMKRVLVTGGVALLSDVHPFRAWLGAQRTFTSAGKTYAVEHHIHSYQDYFSAAQTLHFKLTGIREAGVTGSESPSLLVVRWEA